MKTAIMTDTNSGISVEEGASLGVYVIPMPILIDGETRYEGVTLTYEEFYRSQKAGRAISTSQPAPGDVMALWDRALEECDELVYIPMSSGLSASCHAAMGLSEDYGGRVQVVDNHRISVTQRSAVMDAVALARAGCSAAEIKAELERMALDSVIYIGVDTLEYLKRGGRITPAAAAMGSILHLKPLLKIEGERLDACATVRGREACKHRLLDVMKRSVEEFHRRDWPVCIGAAGSFLTQEEGEAWLALAAETFPGEEIRYDPLALSVGCHTGPGAFGMAVSRRVKLELNESRADEGQPELFKSHAVAGKEPAQGEGK